MSHIVVLLLFCFCKVAVFFHSFVFHFRWFYGINSDFGEGILFKSSVLFSVCIRTLAKAGKKKKKTEDFLFISFHTLTGCFFSFLN